ncbi:MAG: glycosyltransferase family 4 protein [Mucilaginibacter sp.]|nr:glycosyltransferase family 4 protein [Mucilaginibacter sp.]
MKFVFASYLFIKEYNNPESWIERIKAYTGILEALARNNEVISIEQIDYQGEYVKDGVRYYFKRFNRPGTLFPGDLHGFIKSQKPDVVVIQSLHYPLQVIQLRLRLGRKTKIIIHNHAEKPFRGIKKYLQKIADVCTDAYLFASHDMGAEWVETGNLASIKKIHEVMEVSSVFSPVDRAVAKQRTGAADGLIFLWVGRLNENKDPLTVVKAFLQFAGSRPSARLYMIYHTEELLAELQQLLDKSTHKNAVILIGKVPHIGLQYWYNSADIILSGSHYEGSGTAVCEAMSCGCMPVVTDIFSFRMITDNGRCGLLYKAGDQAGLLALLRQTQQMDIREKQKLSLDYFRSNLSFEAIACRIQEIAASL